ncbi:MAG: hypothetical protein LKJ05_02820 [Bifidobacteriaceae bacterium]|jgi:hypothetical protein|nr:hypothetical protein [Bifidobacteriaceae bacterium]
MAFKDYSELADEPLAFPINGTVYTVPPISAKDGLKAQQLIQRSVEGEPIPMSDLASLLLGSAQQQMLDDNVPLAAFTRATITAIADFQQGREIAEATWETAGDPKALEAFLNHLNTKRVAATTTQKPASTNGTKTSQSKPKAA